MYYPYPNDTGCAAANPFIVNSTLTTKKHLTNTELKMPRIDPKPIEMFMYTNHMDREMMWKPNRSGSNNPNRVYQRNMPDVSSYNMVNPYTFDNSTTGWDNYLLPKVNPKAGRVKNSIQSNGKRGSKVALTKPKRSYVRKNRAEVDVSSFVQPDDVPDCDTTNAGSPAMKYIKPVSQGQRYAFTMDYTNPFAGNDLENNDFQMFCPTPVSKFRGYKWVLVKDSELPNPEHKEVHTFRPSTDNACCSCGQALLQICSSTLLHNNLDKGNVTKPCYGNMTMNQVDVPTRQISAVESQLDCKDRLVSRTTPMDTHRRNTESRDFPNVPTFMPPYFGGVPQEFYSKLQGELISTANGPIFQPYPIPLVSNVGLPPPKYKACAQPSKVRIKKGQKLANGGDQATISTDVSDADCLATPRHFNMMQVNEDFKYIPNVMMMPEKVPYMLPEEQMDPMLLHQPDVIGNPVTHIPDLKRRRDQYEFEGPMMETFEYMPPPIHYVNPYNPPMFPQPPQIVFNGKLPLNPDNTHVMPNPVDTNMYHTKAVPTVVGDDMMGSRNSSAFVFSDAVKGSGECERNTTRCTNNVQAEVPDRTIYD
ncbi:uncharacterized protein BBOV_IV004310 [Babesia bovis T2Bo]|uniref:Uncharacterized protein n=1 Tax=Babesia bovis TaxID=5865 RepID=A7AQH3_BABBO|nr:uncharacterized protein BBOV_IV004310 [Babesia bovis T2Bo]EDO06792.1 hypothetical protein BBOV_IV004310 [Babesia bovis T2Bo]|eukprot:XP_001610360.1 hypothetical protein [Babesia bovis T2Bo]